MRKRKEKRNDVIARRWSGSEFLVYKSPHLVLAKEARLRRLNPRRFKFVIITQRLYLSNFNVLQGYNVEIMSDLSRICSVAKESIPIDAPEIIPWAHENVMFPTSARSRHFNIEVTPWLREPLLYAVDVATRVITLRKPVQSGGSAFGEVLLLYWITFWRGFLQYNWSNDKRAKERFESRIDGILKSCAPVAEKLTRATLDKKGDVDFGNVFFRMQGAFVADNLDSDSVQMQINEEVHSWEPGHLRKARNRSTAVWNFKSVDISNAGAKGDQLDKAFNDGTIQHYEVKCPGCGKYHEMIIRFDLKRPDLGGLRYNADGCRRGTHEYDYQKLRSTIQYQMPCGFTVHNQDDSARRLLSLSGRYSEPKNTGAELSHRSFTYQAVVVDYIDWMVLIKDKHDALRARSFGNNDPWRIYITERECLPYDVEEVPSINTVELTLSSKKSREGLPSPKLRFGMLDRQAGQRSKGEMSHWWILIRDFKVFFGVVKSVLVYEGRAETDEEALKILDSHDCPRHNCCADSGDDTDHVYEFCYRNGINAIKGGKEQWYSHQDGARRIYSQERPIHAMLNRNPKYQYAQVNIKGHSEMIPDPREPMFWLYSKGGIRERLYFLRTETDFETPGDVSQDYTDHNSAEERGIRIVPLTGESVVSWKQVKRRNDLFVCECYGAMMFDMSGASGTSIAAPVVETENQSK